MSPHGRQGRGPQRHARERVMLRVAGCGALVREHARRAGGARGGAAPHTQPGIRSSPGAAARPPAVVENQ